LFKLVRGWFPFKSPFYIRLFLWIHVVSVTTASLAVVVGGFFLFFCFVCCFYLVLIRDWVVAFGFVNPLGFGSNYPVGVVY
jgi:hypothetical protein